MNQPVARTTATAAEEFPQSIQVSVSTYPGTTYPVREIPHSDIHIYIYIYIYIRLQSDNSLSLFSLLGTWTGNVARVLIKTLANGGYYISIIINYFYRTIMGIDVWVTFLI